MDRFSELKAFSLVASTGGFSSAARYLSVAPSSVVRLVDGLEKRIGATLLNRSTRSVTLTDSGRTYFESARAILEQMEAADNAASARESEPQGLLRVTAPVTFSTMYIAPILGELGRRYPKLQLDFHLNDGFSNMIDESIDVAIRIGSNEEQPNLIARRLTGHERIICASPAYLAAHGTPQEPADLLNHNCLQFSYDIPRRGWRLRRRSGSDQNGHGAGDGHIEEINVSGMLSINNSEMLRRALLEGMGISMLADWLVHRDLAEGSLVRVLADYQANPGSMDVGLYAMYPVNRRGSVKVKAFVDLLAEHLQATLQHLTPACGAAPAA